MKKIALLLLASFLLLSCSVNKYTDTYSSFSDGVDFKVTYINHYKFNEMGETPNTQYIAHKGKRILQATFKLKNNTSQDKELKLRDFYLVDSKNKMYEPTSLGQYGKINGGGYRRDKQFDITLKANKERTFVMSFKPAMDKNEKITAVVVNGKEYKLNFSS